MEGSSQYNKMNRGTRLKKDLGSGYIGLGAYGMRGRDALEMDCLGGCIYGHVIQARYMRNTFKEDRVECVCAYACVCVCVHMRVCVCACICVCVCFG